MSVSFNLLYKLLLHVCMSCFYIYAWVASTYMHELLLHICMSCFYIYASTVITHCTVTCCLTATIIWLCYRLSCKHSWLYSTCVPIFNQISSRFGCLLSIFQLKSAMLVIKRTLSASEWTVVVVQVAIIPVRLFTKKLSPHCGWCQASFVICKWWRILECNKSEWSNLIGQLQCRYFTLNTWDCTTLERLETCAFILKPVLLPRNLCFYLETCDFI